ncbi:PREDICTED: uncharacterized protein LOC109158116 isoform X2 [Ipomoea nil]|uniref:uncharacterized protein LOC109158116 isoform X1 n=1 Tax=Ipomoea nil TaxID=35883 RepID=UPI0009012E81|nr:PREDICTED: uncharacterized protein LOC109158116 isoform X1 [Ipomoea nil]XP_019161483.1 PREDICTED: uncharacterized protein LOC109158116 isoform X2 [Ipomoea nil]
MTSSFNFIATPNFDYFAREASRLKKEIIRIILSGKTDSLRPNSGWAATIGEHKICVWFCDRSEPGFRVWDWHGSIMLFDDVDGYTSEHILGKYYERLTAEAMAKKKQTEEEEKVAEKFGNLGVRELIESGEEETNKMVLF